MLLYGHPEREVSSSHQVTQQQRNVGATHAAGEECGDPADHRRSHCGAKKTLNDYRDQWETWHRGLLEYESLTGEEIRSFNGESRSSATSRSPSSRRRPASPRASARRCRPVASPADWSLRAPDPDRCRAGIALDKPIVTPRSPARRSGLFPCRSRPAAAVSRVIVRSRSARFGPSIGRGRSAAAEEGWSDGAAQAVRPAGMVASRKASPARAGGEISRNHPGVRIWETVKSVYCIMQNN